jgi:hypothetical protein
VMTSNCAACLCPAEAPAGERTAVLDWWLGTMRAPQFFLRGVLVVSTDVLDRVSLFHKTETQSCGFHGAMARITGSIKPLPPGHAFVAASRWRPPAELFHPCAAFFLPALAVCAHLPLPKSIKSLRQGVAGSAGRRIDDRGHVTLGPRQGMRCDASGDSSNAAAPTLGMRTESEQQRREEPARLRHSAGVEGVIRDSHVPTSSTARQLQRPR